MVVSVVVFAPPIYFCPADVAVFCFGNLAGNSNYNISAIEGDEGHEGNEGVESHKSF